MVILLACTSGEGPGAKPGDTEAEDTAPGGDSAVDDSGGEDTAPEDSDSPAEEEPPPMAATRLLARVSLDVRGVRPTLDELAAVEADAAALDALIDTFLADPRWEERLVGLVSEVFLTRADTFPAEASQLGIDDEPGFAAAIGEEPLRLYAHVAAADRPYYELVTGDYTVANPLLAEIWGLEHPGGGWTEVHHDDGRPAAGILATQGLWWRFGSTRSNAHRARANVVSRTLLCNDYLARPIEFDRDIDLVDEDAVADALANNPACVGCHVSLDPFGSYFWGFWWYVEDSPVDMTRYHPERETLWRDYGGGVAPGYYGSAGSSLRDLGWAIAADPRFPDCAVETAFELLLRRDATLDDFARLSTHRAAFLDGELRLRALYRSVLDDPDYRAGTWTREGAVPTKLMTPDLLASAVEGITGYRWSQEGWDMLLTDRVGLRTLAGGADGATVTRNITEPNATLLLVQERLSQLAAAYAVETDRGLDAAERRVFRLATFRESPEDTDTIGAQVEELYRLVLTRPPSADELGAMLELWSEVYDLDRRAADAWAAVLGLLLRDPDFLLY